MPALNFQAQWAEAVEAGALVANGEPLVLLYQRWDELPDLKRTTIRKPDRAKPGQTLYLYTGQRTKACRKLGEVLCLSVTRIRVAEEGICLGSQWLWRGETAERFARLDTAGQLGIDDFIDFFRNTYGLPFDGELIGW